MAAIFKAGVLASFLSSTTQQIPAGPMDYGLMEHGWLSQTNRPNRRTSEKVTLSKSDPVLDLQHEGPSWPNTGPIQARPNVGPN